ncbi:MAG: cytochrome d ubiquinol oxidase subunit II, partial [Selenomonadaceae bacterium]|nr:cytochrome d ubiquinol oxidase subunit II [Selenomonadaceae bacterium]
LFPRIMVSSISPDFSLNIYNAASTPHTLMLMTGAAVVFVPIVLIYQAWTYKIFKDRVTPADVHYH